MFVQMSVISVKSNELGELISNFTIVKLEILPIDCHKSAPWMGLEWAMLRKQTRDTFWNVFCEWTWFNFPWMSNVGKGNVSSRLNKVVRLPPSGACLNLNLGVFLNKISMLSNTLCVCQFKFVTKRGKIPFTLLTQCTRPTFKSKKIEIF